MFVELFAGFGGLSREIAEVCGGLVHVLEPLDQHGGWDILTDDGFAQAKELVSKADHAHLAFPCRSFSTARRSDQHGDVPVIRSSEKPDGWGSPLAVEGNLILERAIILAFLLLDKGSTFSMENPENSYAWLVSFIQRLKRVVGVIFSGLDQCPFGARTQKPTGILGNAAWMTSINTRCHQVRPHAHMEGGLQGKTWDPITNTWVWKTSKAAEYPQGLCHAWALASKGWLTSKEGYQFMACRTLVKVSPFQMVRLDMVGSRLDKAVTQMEPLDASSSRQRLSKRAVREEENLQAIGGLRDPRRAVARSLKLRRVGERIRTVLDRCYSVQDLLSFEKAVGMGAELVYRCRREMAAEFNVSCTFVSVADYQTDLLESLLQEAEDKDAKVLPGWLRHGVPLGISQPIENTNIFPATDDVSAAIKASQTIGQLLEDWSGKALNYRSFYEAGQKAQSELDRLVTDGRADCVDTWEQVVSMVGTDAKLTQLACIIKNKEGKEKVRLVVDMRRSGINGTMTLLERVVLPRIPDVAKSCDELLKTSNPDDQLEFFVCDFSDAFYTLKLHDSERKWVVCKGLDSRYYVMRCVCFGLACGPLLWGRLASSAMRLAQACCTGYDCRIQCYVDDPILIACHTSRVERTRVFFRASLLWSVLGFNMAWHKASRGIDISWIGVRMLLEGNRHRVLRVSLPEDKTQKVIDALREVCECKGVVPISLLESTTGVMAWISNIIPLARPWTAMLWSALHAAKLQSAAGPKRDTTRVRKGLAFKRQIDHAVLWLHRLLEAKGTFLDGSPVVSLSKVYRFKHDVPLVSVITDACPSGLGGYLEIGGKPVAYFKLPVDEPLCTTLGGGATVGDPAFQTEWELLAIFIAICIFSKFLKRTHVRMFIQSDNTAALRAALEFHASSPLMSSLAAEMAIRIECAGWEPLWGKHIRGIHNTVADALSRFCEGIPLPECLKSAREIVVPDVATLFRTWPHA